MTHLIERTRDELINNLCGLPVEVATAVLMDTQWNCVMDTLDPHHSSITAHSEVIAAFAHGMCVVNDIIKGFLH